MKFIKRATLVALFISETVFAGPKTETHKDIIEKAYNLSLQKDRAQAILILNKALNKESKKSIAYKDVITALEEISSFFYSDKAQQLYELALTVRQNDLNLALSKLQEAGRLEPENLAIQIEVARLYIFMNECAKALTHVKKLSESYMPVETVQLGLAQAAVCSGKFDEYLEVKAVQEAKKTQLSLYWTVVELEYLNKTGRQPKIKELVAAKANLDYPEMIYWQWRSETDLKMKSDKLGQKYIAACKNMTIRMSRQHQYDPTLCKHLSEVETQLKKNNNSDI